MGSSTPSEVAEKADKTRGGETDAHLRLKRRALVWARQNQYRFAAAELRVPNSKYRADVGACRKGKGEEPGATALFECKQSRSDFLSDSKGHAESLAKLKKLRQREAKLEKLVGDHLPSLRVADSLFPEYQSLDTSGLEHEGLRKLRKEIAMLDRTIFGRTKFDQMARWNCADLLYLVVVPGVLDLGEVPSHWGVLVEVDPEAPDDSDVLVVERSPVLLQPGRAARLRLLESMAARATRSELGSKG